MSSSILSTVLFLLPYLCLDLAGILVFQLKFQRVPLVRFLGTLGFCLMLASSGSGLFARPLLESEWNELVFFAIRALSWIGMALVLFAISQIPLVPTLQARELD